MIEQLLPELTNILFCEGNMDGTIGGSFFSLLYLIKGLDRKKYKPIVVFHQEHLLLEQFRITGVEVLVITRPKPFLLRKPSNGALQLFYPIGKLFQKFVNFLKFVPFTGLRYARLLKRHKIRLLHLNNSIIRNNDWMLGAQLVGVKCITHERGINHHYPALARYYARKLQAIICVSNAVRDNLRAHRIDHGNLITIHNAIDPEIVKPDRSPEEIRLQHGIAENAIVIGVIGNIKEWKGQESAIRAMPMVLQRHPGTVCLLVGVVAQTDRDYHERLVRLVAELGVERHVIFTGFSANIANYLNVMQVVLHTSVEPEPFGRVLIEAMSMKKPLVASRAGAVHEIVQEGVTGITFLPGDHESLGKAILDLLADPQRAEEMGVRGYQRLLDNFHISVNVARTQQLYASILNRKSPCPPPGPADPGFDQGRGLIRQELG